MRWLILAMVAVAAGSCSSPRPGEAAPQEAPTKPRTVEAAPQETRTKPQADEAAPQKARKKSRADGAVLQEARTKFTYGGRPIHPELVHQFTSDISDSGPPVIVTVDVTVGAAKCARIAGPVMVEDGEISYEYQTGEKGSAETASFGYRRHGALRDGTQVLETFDWGGGSGVFQDIVLVRFSVQNSHLYMTVVAERVMGDRSDAAVRVLGDRAAVGIGRMHHTEYVPAFEVRVGDFD